MSNRPYAPLQRDFIVGRLLAAEDLLLDGKGVETLKLLATLRTCLEEDSGMEEKAYLSRELGQAIACQ